MNEIQDYSRDPDVLSVNSVPALLKTGHRLTVRNLLSTFNLKGENNDLARENNHFDLAMELLIEKGCDGIADAFLLLIQDPCRQLAVNGKCDARAMPAFTQGCKAKTINTRAGNFLQDVEVSFHFNVCGVYWPRPLFFLLFLMAHISCERPFSLFPGPPSLKVR